MKKSFSVLPAAIAGIVLLVIILIGANIFVGSTRAGANRLDLTENQIYTLSDGTKKILAGLDTPVTIRFYFTEGSRALPRAVKLYATRVKDFLRQYETYGKGKVTFESIDVQPDTDAEDQARTDGLRSQDVSVSESVYFGAAVSCLDRKETLPQLDPNQESLLEYQISRAITQVVRAQKPKLGLLSGLPIVGNGMPPQMGGQPGWLIHRQLSQDYEMVEVAPDVKEIPAGLSALLVVHPAMISPATEFAIDQYLLKGGKAAIFLDAHHYFSQNQPQNPMMPSPQTPTASTLPTLLKAWGLTFESGLVVGDSRFRFSQGDRVLTGVSSFSGEESIETKDPVTSQLDNVFMILPGGFSGEPSAGIHKNVLVRSSTNTQLFDPMRASQFEQGLLTSAPVQSQSYDMVLRLFGRFSTAFPNGRPGAPAAEPGKEGEKKDETPALKEPTGEGAVVLFADVDMITDNGAFQPNPLFPQYPMPFNGNFSLALNVLEQLAGDANLIGARSRPSSRRPFKVLEEMQAAAEQKFSGEVSGLQKKAEATQEEINKMAQAQGGEDGRFVLTKEMRDKVDALNKELVEGNKRLRSIQKSMVKEKDQLESKLIWANILIIPLLVAMVGIAIAAYRRQRTAAR
ncbi:MAG: GldG family protein [Verrucomicrobiales bacterium]